MSQGELSDPDKKLSNIRNNRKVDWKESTRPRNAKKSGGVELKYGPKTSFGMREV